VVKSCYNGVGFNEQIHKKDSKNMDNIDQIKEELKSLRFAIEDVQESNSQTFDTNIAHFVEHLSRETAIGQLLSDRLPQVDFHDWHNRADSNRILYWPKVKGERLAIQVDLMRYIAGDPLHVYNFGTSFLSVEARLDSLVEIFLKQVFRPFQRDLNNFIESFIQTGESQEPTNNENLSHSHFIDEGRIETLRSIKDPRFDLTKLIKLCEELNICNANKCYYAVAMITRAIIDHVPPIFGKSSFNEIANNYGNIKSFRDSMLHLSGSAIKISDAHLHVHVRTREVLPTGTQVNFSNDLDVLLAEIIRILKKD
jgi:hypothetical protein